MAGHLAVASKHYGPDFDDSIERVANKPADSASLDSIHGIGQAKRERWGDDFLGVIRAFLSASPNSG
jgi:hypothetical protein